MGLKKTPPVEKPGADVVYKGYDYLFPWTIDLKRGVVRTGRLEFAAQPRSNADVWTFVVSGFTMLAPRRDRSRDCSGSHLATTACTCSPMP